MLFTPISLKSVLEHLALKTGTTPKSGHEMPGDFEARSTFLSYCTGRYTKEEQTSKLRLVKCEDKGEILGKKSPDPLTT